MIRDTSTSDYRVIINVSFTSETVRRKEMLNKNFSAMCEIGPRTLLGLDSKPASLCCILGLYILLLLYLSPHTSVLMGTGEFNAMG